MSPFQKKQLALEERRGELSLLLDVEAEERSSDFQDKLGAAKTAVTGAQAEVAAAALAEPDPQEVKEETRVSTPEGG